MRNTVLWTMRIIVWIAMAVTLVVGVRQTAIYAKGALSVIWAHPGWSDEDKIRSLYGSFYNLMLYVQRNTPVDSVIIIPPSQDPWYTSGNEAFVRSFLYPRTIVRSKGQLPPTAPKNTFALIVVGPNGEPWPTQPPVGVTYIEPGWGLLDLNSDKVKQ